MIRIAMLSFWHVHAKDYARQTDEHSDTEIAAIWDEMPERGLAEANARSVKHYSSLEKIWADPAIDGVVVGTPTHMHRDVMVRAAAAGKHIFTEKVLAPTVRECDEIVTAVNRAGVKLTVSLPRLNAAYTLAILDVLHQGVLGKLTQARVRVSHNGAIADWLPAHFYNKRQSGGGALIDLGCHPMYLIRLFMGMPRSVSAQFGYITGREVEDNAAVLLKYEGGAIGIVEAGFVNSQSPFCIELHGTEGPLLFGFQHDQLLLRANKADEPTAKQWQSLELPEKLPSAFHQWVSHIQNHTTAEENIRLAVDLTALMEASNLSAHENRTVFLNE